MLAVDINNCRYPSDLQYLQELTPRWLWIFIAADILQISSTFKN
jgi:hypothetical protein